jgi:hypothetical protein
MKKGRFDESVEVSRSLARMYGSTRKTVAKPGQGDRGDRPKSK